MRTLLCALALAAGIAIVGACQNTASPTTTTRPGHLNPTGPLDTVTNPMNQPRFDSHGLMH
jgi:hypothetical protein